MPIGISCKKLRLPTMEGSLSLSNSTSLLSTKDYRPYLPSFFNLKLSINNLIHSVNNPPKFIIKSPNSLPPPQPYSRSTITPTPSTTAVTISSFATPYATATTTSSTDEIITLPYLSPVAYEECKKLESYAHALVRPPSMDIYSFTDITHFLSPHKHHQSFDLPSLSVVKLKKTISPQNSFNTLSSLSRPPQYPRSTFTLRCVAKTTATTTSSTPSTTAKTFQGLCYVVGDNIGTDQLGSNFPFFEAGEFKSKYCVIIAGQNFCCGSFGELVTRALEAAGIHTVVAESYARTCVSNSVFTGKVHLLESDMKIRDENRTGDVVAIVLGVGEPLLINRTTGKEYRLKHSAGDAKSVTGAGAVSKTVSKARLEIDVLGKNVLSLRGEGEKVSMGKTAETAS